MKVLGALAVLTLLVSAISGALEEEEEGPIMSARGDAMEAAYDMAEPVMMSAMAMEGNMMPPPSAPRMSKSRSASAKSYAGGGGGGGGSFSGGGGGGGYTLGEELLSQSEGGKFDPKSVETMLVRRGNMDIASDSAKLETIADDAAALVVKAGGFISDRNTHRNTVDWGVAKGESRVTIFMTLKVPVAKFFPTVTAIKALVSKEEVVSSSDSVEDVTDQFVDVAARAATLDATRLQLVKLMEKADEVDQVLKIQRELSNVVQQLESKKARMEVLKEKSGTSTINLSLRPKDDGPDPPPTKPGWSLFRTIQRAFRWLARMCTSTVDMLIFVAVGALPLCFVGWLVVKACGMGGPRVLDPGVRE